MEKKSTKVLEDRNLRKYADHHLNLAGRAGSGSDRAFLDPARDKPGPEKPGLVSGRGLKARAGSG
jgi:hypothetical protein